MNTRRFFHQMRSHALNEGGRVLYVCVSKGSRAMAWKAWKDWSGPMVDGPLHDNSKFITRFDNGGTVEFPVSVPLETP